MEPGYIDQYFREALQHAGEFVMDIIESFAQAIPKIGGATLGAAALGGSSLAAMRTSGGAEIAPARAPHDTPKIAPPPQALSKAKDVAAETGLGMDMYDISESEHFSLAPLATPAKGLALVQARSTPGRAIG